MKYYERSLVGEQQQRDWVSRVRKISGFCGPAKWSKECVALKIVEMEVYVTVQYEESSVEE